MGVDELLLAAATSALRPLAMSINDIDAFWLGTVYSGNSGLTLSRALRVRGKPVTRVENFCATGSDALRQASLAVASGACDVAMAIGVEKLKDGSPGGLPMPPLPFDGTGLRATAPSYFSLLANGYQRRYGLDDATMRSVLTRIAWKNHRNGALNPLAHFQKEVSLDTIQNSPRVAGHLGVLDCSGVSDGAAAAIVVRAEDASSMTDKPVFVKSLAMVGSTGAGPHSPKFDYSHLPEVALSAEIAYAEAGIDDPLDRLCMAEVHDCFTPTELVLMEDLGFCGRGTAWRHVLQGDYDIGGLLPVNPDGGLKSFGHPVGASGLRMLHEVWLQLRGEAGPDRQVATNSPRNLALTHNLGGFPGDSVSFVGIFGSELEV